MILMLVGCSTPKAEFEDLPFSIVKTIKIENEQFTPSGFDFELFNDSLIYAYDIMNAVVFKYDSQGKLLSSNRFQKGINEVNLTYLGGLYLVNEDSVFALEMGLGNLLLLDSDLKIKNSWNVYRLTEEQFYTAPKTQIINFEATDDQPIITLSATSKKYSSSQKEHYETSFLAIKLNLKTGESRTFFKYPQESSYRNNLFWGDEDPYYIFDNGVYYASFSFDPNLYSFIEDSEEYRLYAYDGKLNKKPTGVQFGMNQGDFIRDHQVEVYYNQNDFNLISKNILNLSDRKYFIRAVRKAMKLGEQVGVSDIMLTNNFVHDYIFQIVDLNQKSPHVWKEYLLPKEYKNFSYIDQEGRFYFKRGNMDAEEYLIDVVELDVDGL